MKMQNMFLFSLIVNSVFYFNNIHFMTRVLNEKYPDVRGVIPKQYQTRIKVERKPLEETISRALYWLKESTR